MSEHRLSQIVIERPRQGWRVSLKKVGGYRKQLDHLTQIATEEGLLSPCLLKPRHKTKWLSDHLGPLRRYLQANIGKPWNDVHSQLCQRLDSNTVAGQHVLDHVWDYVERHVELIDDIPYRKSNRRAPLSYRYGLRLYVHPDTGILCDAKQDTKAAILTQHGPIQSTPEPTDRVILDPYHQYRQLDEIWYLITFQPLPPIGTVFDVIDRITVVAEPTSKSASHRLYAAHKRQCNKREIKLIQKQLQQQNK
jgi:hypothetical protein